MKSARRFPARPPVEAELKSIVDDLKSPANHTQAPAELVERAVQRYDAVRRKRFEETIASLTPMATTAHSAHDVDQLDDLLREIDYHAETERFNMPPTAANQLVDARAWLADQLRIRSRDRAFKRDREALEQMLERPVTAAKLRALRDQLASHQLDLPDELKRRADNAQAIADAYERRRRILLV